MSPSNPFACIALPLAVQARSQAKHYAGFKVGAVGWYFLGNQTFFLWGSNSKRTRTAEKLCAEMVVMRDAATEGVFIEGLVVIGKPRREDEALTLHPCEACRTMMRDYMSRRTVIRPCTHITCVGINSRVEEFTVQSLFAAHEESW